MIHETLSLVLATSLASIGPILRPLPVKPRPPAARHAEAGRDNPVERLRWEWEQLRDPRTGEIPRGIRRSELDFVRSIPTVESLQGRSPLAPALQTWTARGPFDVAGRIRALALDRADATESTLLAASASGGVWRTTDKGVSWTKSTTMPQLHSSTCLAQDTRTGQRQTWYYGTGERKGNSASGGGATYFGDGIFKSTDGGVSFTLLPATSTATPQSYDNDFDFVWQVAIDPSNLAQAEVYAATPTGLQRTLDGGASWTRVLGDGNSGDSADVAVTSTGLVYAANSNDSAAAGIWVSTDGTPGSFANINPPGLPANYGRITIGVSPANESIVYFLAVTPGSGTNGHSLYRYDRNTNSWQDRSANLPGDLDTQGGYDMYVAVKPGSDIVYVAGTNVYRSNSGFADGAQTLQVGGYGITGFTQPNGDYPNHHPDQHALVFSPTGPDRMWSGNDGGVYRTDDNTQPAQFTWVKLNSGLRTTQFYSVAIDTATAGNPIVVGGLQDRGNFFTSDPGNGSWPELTGSDGAVAGVANGRAFYTIEIQNGVLRRMIVSDTGVVNTGLTTRIDPAAATGKRFVHPYALDPNSSEILYYPAGTQLWRNLGASTADTTTGWQGVLGSVIAGQGTFSAIAVSRTPANRVYLGTTNGQVYRLDDASTGTSLALTDIWTGKGLPAGAFVSGIAVDPTDANKVLLVFSNYGVISVYFTDTGGGLWTAVSGNLEQNPDGSGNGPSVRAAAITAQGATRTYFVATSTGVYSASALGTGTVWAQEAAGVIGNVVATGFAYRPVDNMLVVGTHGAGVYSTTIGGGDPCAPDLTPPVVTPNPLGITVNQSTCVGGAGVVTLATLQARDAAAGAAFNAFLNTGATAVDGCSAVTRLPTRVGATDVVATTPFPLGNTTALLRFSDVAGNVGSSAGTVTVRRQGDVDLSGVVDVFDVVTIQNRIVGNVAPGTAPFLAPTDKVADNDNSGVVDVFDVILEANFIVGNSTCLTP